MASGAAATSGGGNAAKTYPFGLVEKRTERNIPMVTFISDVPEFMKQDGAELKNVMEALDGLYNELKALESRFVNMRQVHKMRIPEIEETISVVEFLQKKAEAGEDEPMITNFQLSASIFAEAKVNYNAGKVVLWLGASTAAELTFEEALDILKTNLKRKEDQLAQCEEDLQLTKKQVTTAEVCMARVYNNDVKERRAEAAAKAASGKAGDEEEE
ncbi:Prefoldin subunit 3 [Hondaea fermentalgiana]|uniref:Prefoldin subunit 3 n=1 Tax=Hondaea fermentalgiana TaxID=2315210 RepID=A0A2R5GVV7_9STRA|nr:Prefoldin subunit 3 [Hondaea fermentalgiana]|eukprot:GBG34705.1 Prefoldin subunit 3 [Hondaea fermentalgiana]